MNKVKLLLLFALTILTLAVAVRPVFAFDLFGEGNCYTTDSKGNKIPVKDSKGNPPPACQQAASKGNTDPVSGTGNVFAVAVDIIALITGLAAVIMIILSGLTMITSSGNAEAVTTARRRLLAAIAGLILIILAWTIVNFVLSNI